ncbi:MAG: GNAT family N-acetyltransferase [Bryobacteraceae bacterium]|jgi:GNAT superfamily N-acetyltransferase
MIEVRQLTASEGRQSLGALADVLVDCVEGGASVSFMAPFPKSDAEKFFEKILFEVETGGRILVAAFDGSKLVGTVQVVTALPPNQPHRGEIAKLLVLRSARGQGVATLLMQRAEECARRCNKALLVLDTVTGGDAERLYQRLGWTKAGVIPNYALYPDGRFCDTTIFWKHLSDK